MTPLIIALVAQAAVSIVLVAWTRVKVRRFLGAEEELERIRREIGALIVELDASADRNVTVLEDRLLALKDSIAEADNRIALLGQERSRRQAEAVVYDRLGRTGEPRRPVTTTQATQQATTDQPLGMPPATTDQPQAQVRAQASEPQARLAAENGPERTTVGQAAPPPALGDGASAVPFIRFSDKPIVTDEPFADKVVSLARRGFSSDIIAARLGATMAEVDLALAIEREREARTKE